MPSASPRGEADGGARLLGTLRPGVRPGACPGADHPPPDPSAASRHVSRRAPIACFGRAGHNGQAVLLGPIEDASAPACARARGPARLTHQLPKPLRPFAAENDGAVVHFTLDCIEKPPARWDSAHPDGAIEPVDLPPLSTVEPLLVPTPRLAETARWRPRTRGATRTRAPFDRVRRRHPPPRAAQRLRRDLGRHPSRGLSARFSAICCWKRDVSLLFSRTSSPEGPSGVTMKVRC